ncbi:MerR family transcriptional regulator [Intestinibacillus massiliensis]|uniref:MerR family transcriptional regulator n=1 Tax=Intestinibacillus massiliensis TaxID=1871029 RepID=UPI000B3580BC|nr:MerR family transcriptional regulator [Intestinibacillus massiliensis]MCB6367149.1 MerR family transcriptional regulator [Intestinibacillus massiliensis]
MRIKEVEALTGITAKNIRFYEKEGLLSPARENQNKYRTYSDTDVETLKKIKLLRKLGVSLDMIRLCLEGKILLRDCIELREQEIRDEQERLFQMKSVCDMLHTANPSLDALEPERYLHEIETREGKGGAFINIIWDCLTYARNILPKPSFWFEPDQPIMDRADFTDELIAYSRRTGKTLDILHEGMEPIARIDGVKYLFILETPRTLHFRGSIFFASHTYGFRFAYAYKFQ